MSYSLIGCDSGDRNISSQDVPQSASAGQTAGSATSGAPMSGGSIMGSSASGGATDGGSMAGQQPPNLKPIKDAQAAYDAAKKAYTASPNDEKAKKAFVDATNDLADANMFSDEPPRVKYPNALKYYREAAKTDPTNEKAKQNVDLIVGIYKQMRKTPPAEGG
ncbi:MAG TPA: hypothetical protein VHE55_19655 [Fimbriimonadaceae bacterium]|nr:hypothetical protein [Fimbriimonadaceae bacterium]